MRCVPFLIDGNNLMHALAGRGVDVGRAGLCRLLAGLAAGGHKVHVVFDGRPRSDQSAEPAPGGCRVDYSGRRSADEVIADLIAADTAPRRLTVVSTDHAIRQAARKRRCRVAASEDFALTLVRAARRPRPQAAREPPEKSLGLTPEQTESWLRELNLQGEDDDGQDADP